MPVSLYQVHADGAAQGTEGRGHFPGHLLWCVTVPLSDFPGSVFVED